MPLFYFDVESDIGIHKDPVGAEFPDLEAAMASALLDARALAGDRLRFGQPLKDDSIVIRDNDGNTVGKVRVVDAVLGALSRA